MLFLFENWSRSKSSSGKDSLSVLKEIKKTLREAISLRVARGQPHFGHTIMALPEYISGTRKIRSEQPQQSVGRRRGSQFLEQRRASLRLFPCVEAVVHGKFFIARFGRLFPGD